MNVSFDREQVQLVRETLQSALKELRNEIAHTDTNRFRDMLHHREEVLESVIAKIADADRAFI